MGPAFVPLVRTTPRPPVDLIGWLHLAVFCMHPCDFDDSFVQPHVSMLQHLCSFLSPLGLRLRPTAASNAGGSGNIGLHLAGTDSLAGIIGGGGGGGGFHIPRSVSPAFGENPGLAGFGGGDASGMHGGGIGVPLSTVSAYEGGFGGFGGFTNGFGFGGGRFGSSIPESGSFGGAGGVLGDDDGGMAAWMRRACAEVLERLLTVGLQDEAVSVRQEIVGGLEVRACVRARVHVLSFMFVCTWCVCMCLSACAWFPCFYSGVCLHRSDPPHLALHCKR